MQGLATAGPLSPSYLPLGGAPDAEHHVRPDQRRCGNVQSFLTAVKEMRAVLDADAELSDFMELTTPTLMLSGGWSPGYFADTGRQLAAAVPAIDFAVVPGQLHEGPIRPGKRLAVRMARFLNGTDGTITPRSRKRRRV